MQQNIKYEFRLVYKVLLVFFFSFSLFAKNVLPVLVEEGETFKSRNNFYIPSSSEINSIAMSPNSKWVALGLKDNTIQVWDIKTGNFLKLLEGHNASVTSVVISDDSKLIVSGSYDNSIKIWSSEKGKVLRTLKGHNNRVLTVAISQDRKIVISGSTDNNIKIWNTETGELMNTLKGHKNRVTSVAISKDSKIIVSASRDKTIKIWNPALSKEKMTLKGHKERITFIAISNNSKWIVSTSWDNTIKIWDVVTGRELKSLEKHTSNINSLAISSDWKRLVSASSNGNIKIWDTKSGKELKHIKADKESINGLVISPNGKKIVSASKDGNIKVWDMKSGKELKKFNAYKESVNSVDISSNGKLLVSSSYDYSIKVWDIKNKKLLKNLIGHKRPIRAVIISPNGKEILSGSDDKSLRVWDIKSGKEIKKFEKYNSTINSIALSANGKIVVLGLHEGIVKIQNMFNSNKVHSLEGHSGPITSVVITPNGKNIVSASSDKTIKVWDIDTGELLRSLEKHTDTVWSVAITPNGKNIVSASSDKTIKVWDIETGEELRSIEGHTYNVNSVAISPNGKIIVSASSDKSVRIWDMESGKELGIIEKYRANVNSVVISPNGKIIVSGSWDGSIYFWDIEKKEKLLKEFIVSREGKWIIFDNEKKLFFRGDNGTLLYRKNGADLSLLNPKWLTNKDDINISTKGVTVINDNHNILNIAIQNISDKRLYWVKNHYYEDKYCHILEYRVSNIDSNLSKKLLIDVAVTLPKINPKPIDKHDINLTLETAGGKKVYISLPISIRYANIVVSSAEVSKDGKNLNIVLKNIGNEKLLNAKVKVLEPFVSNVTEINQIEANTSQSISFPIIHEFEENTTLMLDVYISNDKDKNVEPLYEWNIKDIKIKGNKPLWYIYIFMLLGVLLLIIATLYFKRYRNSLVLQLQSNPKKLLTLNPKLLEEAQRRLSSINQWQTILKSANISQERFDETVDFFKSSYQEKAKIISERIGAEQYKEGNFFRLNMPKSFNLNIDTFLLYFPEEELGKEILDENDKVLVIGKETYEQEIYKLATDRSNRLICPTQEKLTEFLLSSQSEEVLIEIFSECLLFKDISPYQVNSGVMNESNFFGRVEIIRDIISKNNANYLVVGGRQLGKSSIIKALERRYEGSAKVQCYSFTMENENIVLEMSTALGMNANSTLKEVVQKISRASKKSVFLIDEADRFVKHEKELDYEVTEVFRKLSQEGKATFVLTGFWTLYFYVTSDHHSPLKNFGELIKLEGLDHEACQNLMLEPMKRIGVSYEDERIVENVIAFCGRRPNLIAITCNEVLKNLEGKVISQADIDAVVKNASLEDYLKGWGSMSEDKYDNCLDRVVVYLSLEKESFRLADVDAWLKEKGKKIDVNKIKSSLERLVVGYIFEERKKNYSYRVPLFRDKLLEDDIEILLEGDLEQL